MAGVIRADVRGDRCECGGEFKRMKRKGFDNEIPVCEKCYDFPDAFVIRMTLPGAPKKDIRYSIEGKRLVTAAQADATLSRIRDEVKSRTFDYQLYLSNKNREAFKFRNFLEEYIGERKAASPEKRLTPSGEQSIRTVSKNYLVPYFGNTLINDINSVMIKRYYVHWKPVKEGTGTRTRDVSLEVLRTVLRYAKNLGYVREVPVFPKLEKSKKSRKFISKDEQDLIIAEIPNVVYQTAILVMRALLARPLEVTALQRRDLDRATNVVHIRRHFSKKNVLLNGRKSIKSPEHDFFDHIIPVRPEFWQLIDRLPVGLDPESFVFRKPDGSTLGRDALSTAWRKAVVAANKRHRLKIDIDLYRGIKSSTAQHFYNSGVDKDSLRRLMGQATFDVTSHYVKESAESLRGVAEGVQATLHKKTSGNSF